MYFILTLQISVDNLNEILVASFNTHIIVCKYTTAKSATECHLKVWVTLFAILLFSYQVNAHHPILFAFTFIQAVFKQLKQWIHVYSENNIDLKARTHWK